MNSDNPLVQAFYDESTGSISYVVYDFPGGTGAVIDPVLDYDPKSGCTCTDSAQKIISFVMQQQLKIDWILETHIHADHLSAAQTIKQHLGGKLAISKHIQTVKKSFSQFFNFDSGHYQESASFDHLFNEDECFSIGRLSARAIYVPGHTPADTAYLVGSSAFVGDTVFMPDIGTARCDFPGGDANKLYDSIQKIFNLPLSTRLFMCHDYPPASRNARWLSNIPEQQQFNIHINHQVDKQTFIKLRQERDATLDLPTLLLPAIQFNLRAGHFPAVEYNGIRYFKIPINTSLKSVGDG